jgi:very-short-patch-repair endonuclease
MSDFDKFLAIRKAYAEILPVWMAEYEATGDMRQDPYFMDWDFTPIEQNVWSDIRGLGLPFYPQVPVLNYFVDFACPFLKIGIECDGKAWHKHDLDKARDARLAAAGWMIFRIEGHECKRVIEPFYESEYEELDEQKIYHFFLTTSEGVMTAIKNRYFDENPTDKYSYFMDATLFEHRSTPETFPVRRKIANTDPVLLRISLAGYLDVLFSRMTPAA